MDGQVAGRVRPIESDARSPIVNVFAARTMQKRLHDGVDLAVVADVFGVGIEIVAQPKVQGELPGDVPVVLCEERQIVVIAAGQQERTIGIVALQRDCKQQVVPSNLTVAVAIEVGKVLHGLDTALLEDPEIKAGGYVLHFRPELEIVLAARPVQHVAELKAVLLGGLRNAERSAILQTGQIELRRDHNRSGVVKEVVFRKAEAVEQRRRNDVRPSGDERLELVLQYLPL